MNEHHSLDIYYHTHQQEILSSPARVKVIAKGRRFGLTKGYANHIIEKMFEGLSPILWVDALYTNIDRYVERYFIPILRQLPTEHWKWRQQKKELSIFDRKCDFRSADRPELLEGFAYRLIILNEAGIILKNEYLWENAIRPMIIDYSPDQLIGGTPKGRNVFFDLKVKAQDDKDPRYKDWQFFHFTSYDNPYVNRQEIDALVADMPEHVRKQEIFAEFLEDSASTFRNVDGAVIAGYGGEKPRPKMLYYGGVDLAKHVDFTVITILDEQGKQVYFNRLNKLDWPYQKRLISDVIRHYKARVVMDSTGVGDPIFDDLRNDGVDVQGYKFTNESKKKLIECLMLSFEHSKIRLIDEPVQTNELKMFGYEISPSGVLRYNAPEGKHDDTVIALALANWCRENMGGRQDVWVLQGEDDGTPWHKQVEEEYVFPADIEQLSTPENAKKYLSLLRKHDNDMGAVAKDMGISRDLLRRWITLKRDWIQQVGQGGSGKTGDDVWVI